MSRESFSKKISVVIVDFNSSKHTINLIRSLKLINIIVGEVIIVVNGENLTIPNTIIEKRILVIKNKSNLGFSKAVNIGIKHSKFDNILLLNPDAALTDGSIVKMYKYFSVNDDIAAIGGKILDYKTNINRFSATSKPNFMTAIFEFTNLKKIFPDNYFSRKFWIEKERHLTEPVKVFSLCGAFIIFRKIVNNNHLYFNEKYFLYLEDIDFGLRVNRMGYKVVFYPKASIKHVGGGTSKSKYKTNLKEWYKSRKIFFRDNSNIVFGIILNIIFSTEEAILYVYHSIKNEPSY